MAEQHRDRLLAAAQHRPPHHGPSTLTAVLFPLLGLRFPISPFKDLGEHMLSFANGYNVAGELIGFALLGWMYKRGELNLASRAAFPPASAAPPRGPPS